MATKKTVLFQKTAFLCKVEVQVYVSFHDSFIPSLLWRKTCVK